MTRRAVRNTYMGGLNRDLSKDKYPNNKYYDAQNVRLLTDGGLSSGSIENIKGTLEAVTLPTGVKIINVTTLDDILIIFATDDTYGYIYGISIDAINLSRENGTLPLSITSTPYLNGGNIIYMSNELNWTESTKIEVLTNYETNIKRKIYWREDNNGEIGTLKYINIDKSFKDGSYLTIHSIDTSPLINITKPKFVGYSTGKLKVGAYQYAYRLRNENGTQTNFSPFSDIIYLFKGNTFNNIVGLEGKEEDYPEVTTKGITLNIDIKTQGFDYIEVISIYYQELTSPPVISILAEKSIQSIFSGTSTVTVSDVGDNYVGNLTIDEVLIESSSSLKPTTFDVGQNYMFLANMKSGEFDVDNWMIANGYTSLLTTDTSSNSYGSYWDARTYRFRKFDNSSIIWSEYTDYSEDNKEQKILNTDVEFGSKTGFPTNKVFNCINQYNDLGLEGDNDFHYYQYKYQDDMSTIGGVGPNIKYEFKLEEVKIGDLISNGKFTYNGFEINSFSEQISKFKTVPRDEIERYGIVFYDKYGRRSNVKWIGDIRTPNLGEYIYNDTQSTSGHYGMTFKSGSTIYARRMYIEFTVKNVPTELKWQIVRVPKLDSSDYSIRSQGILSSVDATGSDYRPTVLPILGDNNNYYYGDYELKRLARGSNYVFDFTSPEQLFFKGSFPEINTSEYLKICGIVTDRILVGSTLGDLISVSYGIKQNIVLYNEVSHIMNDDVDERYLKIPLSNADILSIQYRVVSPQSIGTITYKHEVLENAHSQLGGKREGLKNTSTILKLNLPTSLNEILYSNLSVGTASNARGITKNSSSYSNFVLQFDGIINVKETYVELYESVITEYIGISTINTSTEDYIIGLKYGTTASPVILNVTGDIIVYGAMRKDSGGISSTKHYYKKYIIPCNIPTDVYNNYSEFNVSVTNPSFDSSELSGKVYKSTKSTVIPINVYNGDVLLVNLKQNNTTTRYGGSSYIERSFNFYMPCSDIEDGMGSATTTATKVYGDSFIQMMEVLWCGAKGGQDSVGQNSIMNNRLQTIVTFPVETRLNLYLRDDKDECLYKSGSYDSLKSLLLSEDKSNSLYYDDTLYEQLGDLYRYSSIFSRTSGDDKSRLIGESSEFASTEEYPVRIKYSDKKINGESIDSWITYRAEKFVDVDARYGEIKCIKTIPGKLVFFQEKAVGIFDIDERIMQSSTAGEVVMGSNTRTLDRYQYIITNSGVSNQRAVLKTGTGLYWVDKENCTMYKMTNALETYELTISGGMSSFFRENIIPTSDILLGYDRQFKEVLLYINNTANANYSSYLLAYNEYVNLYTSFYSFYPSIMASVFNSLISTNSSNLNSLYLHNIGNYGYFYTSYYPSYITMLITPLGGLSAVFDVFEYTIDILYNNSYINNDTTIDTIIDSYIGLQATNDYQDTGVIAGSTYNLTGDYLKSSNDLPDKIERRFRKYRFHKVREIMDNTGAITTRKNKMKDIYNKIKLIIDNSGNYRFVVQDLITYITQPRI